MSKFLNNLLTANEQKILFFLLLFAFIGLAASYTGLIAEEETEKPDTLVFAKDHEIKYDLNTVSKEELITIPGIGPKKAAAILDYRAEKPFQNKAELMKIKGIGTKTFAKLEKYFLDLGSAEIPEQLYTEPIQTETKPADSETKLVNINLATAEELTSLKGIGPAKAGRIVELRKELGSFKSTNDLLQVKGIGPKTLEKIKDEITIGE